MAERRFDHPTEKGIAFNEQDVNDMRRFMQAMKEPMERFQRLSAVPLPAGVLIFGLANLCADLLKTYPENFRKKLIRDINTRIFDAEARKEPGVIWTPESAPSRIRLH